MTVETDREFLRLAGEADKAGEWAPLKLRALPPFPVDALPPQVATWVHATAEHTQTPPDLPALAALGALSAAALGGAAVDCGSWEEELALYVLVAMPSGDRKSTVLRAAVQPLREIERERRDLAAPLVREHRSRREVLEVRSRKLTKLAADHNDITERAQAEQDLAELNEELDGIGEPVMPRLLANDATPEALGGLLASHGSIAVLAAESAFIDNIAGRYSDGKANLHLVCAAYSGEPHTIDRKGRDPEHIERPLLAIALTVQPHVLESLITHPIARAQGLVARFAYAMPETRLGRRRINAPAVPRNIANAWGEIVRHVAKTADKTDTNTVGSISVGSVSTFHPTQLLLSAGATAVLTEIQEDIEPRLGPGGDLHSIADWTGRHHGRVARIAGLLHLCEHAPNDPVSESTMRAALRIGDYLLEHGIAALTGPDAGLRAAIRWLEKRGETNVTQRDLHRGPLAGRGTAEEAAALAERLEALGALNRCGIEPAGRGRPPSPTYHVHPDLVQRTEPRPPHTSGHAAATDTSPQRDRQLAADPGDEELLATSLGTEIEHAAANNGAGGDDADFVAQVLARHGGNGS
jgi:replicative DNA helicase